MALSEIEFIFPSKREKDKKIRSNVITNIAREDISTRLNNCLGRDVWNSMPRGGCSKLFKKVQRQKLVSSVKFN